VDAHLDHRGRDQYIQLAALEASHHDLLVVGAEAAVNQTDAQSLERAPTQGFIHLSGGLECRAREERWRRSTLGRLSGRFLLGREVQLRLIVARSLDYRVNDIGL